MKSTFEKFKLDASNIKVLIVDDEPLLREFVKRFLENEGFQTVSAENGKEACEILQNEQVQLIVSDIRMPEMDGVALLDYVSEHHQTIPIFLMTGYSDLSIEDALAKGAKCVLSKPFKANLLLDAVKSALIPTIDKWSSMELEGEEIEFNFKSSSEAQSSGLLEFGNGGFKVKTNKPLYVGDTHLFKIQFSDCSPFEISGKVLWDRLKEDDQVEYGIEITAADEQAIEFLLNKLNILEKQPFIPAA